MTQQEPEDLTRWGRIYVAVAVSAVAMMVALWCFSRTYS